MQEIIDYLLSKGVELSPDTLIILSFLYFTVFRHFQGRLNGLSSYIRKYLVLQRQNVRAHQELSDALKALSDKLTSE